LVKVINQILKKCRDQAYFLQ